MLKFIPEFISKNLYSPSPPMRVASTPDSLTRNWGGKHVRKKNCISSIEQQLSKRHSVVGAIAEVDSFLRPIEQ